MWQVGLRNFGGERKSKLGGDWHLDEWSSWLFHVAGPGFERRSNLCQLEYEYWNS